MEESNFADENYVLSRRILCGRGSVSEFKYRDIIIRLIYLVSFLCYLFDPDMFGSLLAGRLANQLGVCTEITWKHLVLFAGVALALCGVLLRTWATAYLGWSVMRNPRIHTDRLISDGPFGHVRNPLYLGNLLMVAGVSVMFSRTGMVLLLAANLLLISRLIMLEETQLARSYGASYLEYWRAVPRWIPSLKARVSPAGYVPSLKRGISGEIHLWLILIAVAVYAATFNFKLFGILFVCAFFPGASRRIYRMLEKSPLRRKRPVPEESQFKIRASGNSPV